MRLTALAAVLAAFLLAAAVTDAQQPAKSKDDPKAKTDPKSKDDPKAKTDPKAKEAPAPAKFNMKMTVADVSIGTQLMGLKVEAADLKGKVVLFDMWGVHCPPCLAAMPGTAAVYNELKDFGFVVLGAHSQNATPDEVKSVATSRSATFPILVGANVRGTNDNNLLPHCVLFDHTGACILRGRPEEAEHLAREAVGKMLVDGAGRDKFSSSMTAIVSDLKKGKPPLTVLSKLTGLQNSGNPETVADAKALLTSLTASGQKKFEQAEDKAASDPLAAFLLVEKIPVSYKGTALAAKATELIGKLKKDKAVTAELSARPALDAIKKIEQQLAAKPGADDPMKPDFQKANAGLLKQLKDKVASMKKAWPDAKATEEAVVLGERYVK